MTSKPLYAPGCYGLPSVFSKDEICGSCPFSEPCEIAHLAALKQLRAFCGIDVKEPSRARGDLPVKVKKIFEELGRSVTEVRQEMQAGRNPYSLKAGFMGVACHILLNHKTVTRSLIVQVLSAWRQYNDRTADVYARHAIQILAHCGVVVVEGEQVKLVSLDK